MKKNKINEHITVFLAFSVSFFLLLSLGVWQLDKHKRKSDYKNLLSEKNDMKLDIFDNLDFDFEKIDVVNLKGEMLLNKTIFFEPRTHKGKIGYHKIVPFKLGTKTVLVNRGFTLKKRYIKSQKSKTELIKGLIISFPSPKFYELENDIKNNKWYTLNLEQISSFLNMKLYPLLVYEMNSTSEDIINVKPNTISNINHLNYSITWFMLAAILAVFFIILTRKS